MEILCKYNYLFVQGINVKINQCMETLCKYIYVSLNLKFFDAKVYTYVRSKGNAFKS